MDRQSYTDKGIPECSSGLNHVAQVKSITKNSPRSTRRSAVGQNENPTRRSKRKRKRRIFNDVDFELEITSKEEERMIKQALKNSVAMKKVSVIGFNFDNIELVPTLEPSEEEFKNPIQYIRSKHALGLKFGALHIKPPKSWNPVFAFNPHKYHFETRKQTVNKLQQGEGWPSGGNYSLDEYQRMANGFRERYIGKAGIGNSLQDIEKHYWDIVNGKRGEVVVEYGNDIDTSKSGSGFSSDEKSPWNLTKIAQSPDCPLSLFQHDIKGVTVPWLYCGMMFSSFCWHCEDNHLASINYVHKGSPKVWYVAPAKDAAKLESVMKQHLPCLFDSEPDLIHKLCTTIDPSMLLAGDVPVRKVVQREGTFVVTYPRGYHSGFNTGFNVAEAVNVGYDEWFSYGRRCARMYRIAGRPSVFCHDKLLLDYVNHKKGRVSNSVLEELRFMINYQRRWDYDFRMKRMRLNAQRLFEYDDEKHQCLICQNHCFLAYTSCSCIPGAKFCMEHTVGQCTCPLEWKTLHHSTVYHKMCRDLDIKFKI
mmetsp:Transcript_8939/g.14210  ORF Transcript_8939/g.14210 Transcript_8939/m.14210 type:complete len:534 (-) Transcript_8939:145-1746(-)